MDGIIFVKSSAMKIKVLFLLLPLLFSSCIEIIDDITIHNDGTGTFKYSINLSSSKIKVKSILVLDSLEGKKVPSIEEISVKINDFEKYLEEQPGISDVKTEFNSAEFIVKLSCNFSSVSALQSGIKSSLFQLKKEKPTDEYNGTWISFDGKSLNRMVPPAIAQKALEYKNSDIDLLKTGTYVSISRFDRSVDRNSNSNVKINPSKTATMIRVNTYDLRLNNKLIENTTFLIPN